MEYVKALSGPSEQKIRPMTASGARQISPRDPQLSLWTAASVFVADVKAQEELFGAFAKRDLDCVYAESSQLATSLGVPADSWPDTVEEFWNFWDNRMDTLPATAADEGKTIAEQILRLEDMSFWAFILSPLLRACMAYWLPDRLREWCGIRITFLTWVMYRLSVVLVSGLYAFLSLVPSHSPHWHWMDGQSARRKSAVDRSFMVKHAE
ncbi:hypothetical protein PHISP_03267 [Aspergillus sp. HF37]|nr:hypothetical protein PHISP_03267 [Aspergillus sp. HF37]